METNVKKRIDWIDAAKGYGILAVVLGHCFNKGNFIHNWVFSFHLPLFYMLSGYCFRPERYTAIREMAKEKGRTLLIPYIKFWVLGFFVSLMVPEWRKELHLKHILIDLYNGYPSSVHLTSTWFLISLFVCECMLFTTKKCTKFLKNDYAEYICICLFGIMGYMISVIKSIFYDSVSMGSTKDVAFSINRLPLTLDTSMTAVVFFSCGYWLKCRENDPMEKHGKALPVGLLFANIVFGLFLNERVNLHACTLGNGLFFYAAAFAGSGFVICFSKWICSKKNVICRNITVFLVFYGKNSLLMLGMQSLGIHLYVYILKGITGVEYILYETLPWEYGMAAFLLLTAVFLPIAYWINSHLNSIVKI